MANDPSVASERRLGDDPARPVTLAILALGGQGGGVLVDWIIDLAQSNGYLAQATSVAGVAQRTGATIYYLELFALRHVQARGGTLPVLAQMAVPGEVDIVIASELMEAGRAMQRGLVTPTRTTLIASSHRDYATLEKVVPGNGIGDAQAVLEAGGRHARRFLHADLQALARRHGSQLSATLFGALAGCGELPFEASDFEATLRRSGIGGEATLRAWRDASQAMRQPRLPPGSATEPMAAEPPSLPARAASPAVEPLRQRIVSEFDPSAHAMLGAGLQRVLEFQDIAYGGEYLDRVAELQRRLRACGGSDLARPFMAEAARWVAVAMAYDDVIRVADLKTRLDRTQRIRAEVDAQADSVVGVVDFFHPRLQEVLGLLPPALAERVDRLPPLRRWLMRRFERGRRIRSHSLGGYLLLRLVAGLRPWRRRSRRHAAEMAHLTHWLDTVMRVLDADPLLALELLRCRRLVKGYSDTHARGQSRFDRLVRAAERLQGRADAAAALASLRAAALADPLGAQLQQRWDALHLGADALPS
ncbi:MAG: indolepyruvate oxidoreductase subunit beta family protein [Rhodoferax sp.]|nr:indolepyruvate oxidoreductase subunit beta family protein [Rhodoferax sp.]